MWRTTTKSTCDWGLPPTPSKWHIQVVNLKAFLHRNYFQPQKPNPPIFSYNSAASYQTQARPNFCLQLHNQQQHGKTADLWEQHFLLKTLITCWGDRQQTPTPKSSINASSIGRGWMKGGRRWQSILVCTAETPPDPMGPGSEACFHIGSLTQAQPWYVSHGDSGTTA